MNVYCVSKNTGPSWQSDPLHLLYIGTDLNKAIESVGTFVKYEKPWDPNFSTILPKNHNWLPVKWYMADGWWYSIVVFELNESSSNLDNINLTNPSSTNISPK